MRGWVFESIESSNNNNQMILKYIKKQCAGIGKYNNKMKQQWCDEVGGRGWEDIYKKKVSCQCIVYLIKNIYNV